MIVIVLSLFNIFVHEKSSQNMNPKADFYSCLCFIVIQKSKSMASKKKEKEKKNLREF